MAPRDACTTTRCLPHRSFEPGLSAHEQLQARLREQADAVTWDRPLRVGVAPADAQPLVVPAGGVRHAEALGVVWDSVRCIHWIPHSANLSKVVRKMQIFGAVRRSGILGHGQRANATASFLSSPFDVTPADAEETIADLASASPAFSFVPGAPAPPPAGAKDTIPSQSIAPTVDSRRPLDLSDLSRSLPVISGTAVVDGPTKSTLAASAAAAFAVGVVAMASVVQFHDPGTPRTRNCHTAIQLALPTAMLMLLLTACAVTCFDRLTSTRARPQAERRRSRATRFSRGDTQPIHRNTNSDFSMFSSSRQIDFRTAESTLSARRRDHERQIWRCISSFAPIWILLLFIFKWIGAVVVESRISPDRAPHPDHAARVRPQLRLDRRAGPRHRRIAHPPSSLARTHQAGHSSHRLVGQRILSTHAHRRRHFSPRGVTSHPVRKLGLRDLAHLFPCALRRHCVPCTRSCGTFDHSHSHSSWAATITQ